MTTRKRRSGSSFFSFCLLALAASCGVADGQQIGSSVPVSRTIEGSVLDQAGHPVSAAVVLIEDLKSLQVRSYIVQDDGKFRFRGLSSDANYELRARFNGAVSNVKTVSVFETRPVIVVNLTLSNKPKRAPNRRQGNPS